MTRHLRKWISILVFWVLFAASITLATRYLWIKTLWYLAGLLVIVTLSIYSLAYAIRHPDETGDLSVQGIPRWVRRFVEDDESGDADAK